MQLTVDRLGSTIVPALYVNDEIFLPLHEVFRFLGVKAVATQGGRIVSGFFIEEDNRYVVDLTERKIVVGANVRWIGEDELITTETEIFVNPRLLVEAFDIQCSFNFRSLLVRISSTREFPAIRLMKRAGAHDGLNRATDTVAIERRFDRQAGSFHLSVLDWQLASSRSFDGHHETYAAAVGGELLGGDITARVDGAFGDSIGWQDIDWQWRFADASPGFLTQATYGRALQPAFPASHGLLDGFSLTNRPTHQRKAFGTYLIVGKTEPGWTVDVYINRELKTFAIADQSGRYEIPIPLSYGSTNIMLKFLGPWGEERTEQQLLRVPYTFLPPGEIEYAITAGVSRQETKRWLGQGVAYVGLFPDLTIGVGAQYLSRWPQNTISPYASASLRLSDEILASVEFTKDYRLTGRASFVGSTGTSIDATYQRHFADRSTGFASADLHRFRVVAGTPFHLLTATGMGGLAASYESSSPVNSLFGIEGTAGLSLGGWFMGHALYGSIPYSDGEFLRGSLTGSISVSRQLWWQLSSRASLQYDFVRGRFIGATARIERAILGLGQAALSTTHSFVDNRTVVQFDFRYDLPFAGARLNMRGDHGTYQLNQTFNGTIGFDDGAGEFVIGNRSSVGRGTVSLRPFLDDNNNGAMDAGEQPVENLEVKASGGRVARGDAGIVRIMELPPYETCTMEISARNLEYLTWRPAFTSMQVIVDPNSYKEILVPIIVAGEVLGSVHRTTGGITMGQGGIRVVFRSKSSGKLDTVMTFSNGEFDLMGLPPGSYDVFIDRRQLRSLNVVSAPASIDVTLAGTREGDFVDNVQFTLAPRVAAAGARTEEIADLDEPYPIGYSRTLQVSAPGDEFDAGTIELLDGLVARMENDSTGAIEMQAMFDASYIQEEVVESQMFIYRLRTHLEYAGVPANRLRMRPPISNLFGNGGERIVLVKIVPR